VIVTIVETTNVAVNVGIVGRGVMDAVGVSVGMKVFVPVGIGEGVLVLIAFGVIITGVLVPEGVHAVIIIRITKAAK